MKLTPGQCYKIKGYDLACDKDYRRKLLAMGFVPGALFEAVRKAPLGDPIEVRIKGFSVSLRQAEVSLLRVEAV